MAKKLMESFCIFENATNDAFLGNVDSIKLYQKNLDGVEIVLVLYVNAVSN